MTSLVEVASHLPPEGVSIGERFAELGFPYDADVYERYYGFGRVRRDSGARLVEHLCAAAAGLSALGGREKDVRYVVHAPTIQLTAPHPVNPVHEVCRELGLTRAIPLSLTQLACASALLAIDACGKLLAEDPDPDALALILAGEKSFTRVAQIVPDSAVMGEGIAAVLVSARGESDRVLAFASRTLGAFHQAPELTAELDAEFQALYPVTLVEVLRAAIGRAGLEPGDVALILPHNINRMSWLRVLMMAGLPKDRLYLDNQPEYGHCFGADPFISLRSARAGGRLIPGDHYVMTGTGLGATIAAMAFRA